MFDEIHIDFGHGAERNESLSSGNGKGAGALRPDNLSLNEASRAEAQSSRHGPFKGGRKSLLDLIHQE
jgi:hypothetical protein